MTNLAPMRYKNYTWPHNPRTYEITYNRDIAVNRVPFGKYTMTSMGRTFRALRGEGEFAGPGAYDEFKKLATVFFQETPGILVHPVWQAANAYFVSLSLMQEPYEDYVKYEFEFWETLTEYTGGLKLHSKPQTPAGNAPAPAKKSYTVVSGDTMYAIARRNNMTLGELTALNPQIKNPNRIYPGNVIYLS